MTNAGSAIAKAKFSGDHNYNIISDLSATLTISKKDITSLFTFSGKTFSYDGNPHGITVTLDPSVPSSVSISYNIESMIKAGSYNVVATISETTGNYTVPASLSAILKIVKDGAYWDIVFEYDEDTKVEMVIKNNTIITDIPSIDEVEGYNISWSYDGGLIISDNVFSLVKTPIDYDINYVSSISITNSNPKSYNIEDEIVFSEPKTLSDGYVFDGWYLDSEFKNKITKIDLGSIGVITIYAKFIDLHITSNNVGFIKNTKDYSFVAFVYEDTSLNTSYDLSSSFVIPTGATANLYSDSSLNNRITDGVISLSVGENIAYYQITKDNKSYTYMIVINKHNMKTYNAYVDGNVLYTGTKEVGDTLNLPSPSKNGFKFVGWSLENNSSIVVSMPYTMNSDVDFYAYFVSASYTITYKLEDGTVLFTDTVMYSESYSLHSPYINGEYASVKWIIDNVEYDIDYTFDYNYSKNLVIYAKMALASSDYSISIDSNNNASIVGYNGTSTNITIPSYVLSNNKYYYVNSIASEAFMNNTSLNKVIINDNIESIGIKAFYNTNISFNTYNNGYYLGDNVNQYKWLVGMDLTKNSLIINENTNNVSFGALYDSHIESITLPFVGKNRDAAGSIDGVFGYLFGDLEYTDSSSAIQYGENKESKTYYIPDSLLSINLINLEVIPYGAFYNVAKVEEIIIPETVKEIKEDALRNMSSLASLAIPSSVDTLSEGVISGCLSLTDLTLPFVGASKNEAEFSKATLFGYVFGTSSTGLNSNDYVNTRQYYSKSSGSVGNKLPKSLANVTILGGKIYYGSFYNCSMIKSIKLGSDIVSISNPNDETDNGNVFYKCTSLEDLYLPKGFTHFSNSFKSITSLKNIYFSGDEKDWAKFEFSALADNPMSIASNIYFKNGNDYNTVTSLDLSNIENINNYSFYNFKDVLEITLSNTKTIGEYAFYNCSKVSSLDLPLGLTTIGSYALSNMSGLTSLVIPNTVNTLELGMLSGDGSLESITLPRIGNSSETIASEKTLFGYIFGKSQYDNSIAVEQNIDATNKVTFYIPANLAKVMVKDSNSILFYGAFHNCNMIEELYLEGNLREVAPRSLAGLSLNKLYLPKSIENIYGLAFYKSSALNVYYDGDLSNWLNVSFIASSSSGDLTTGSNPKCITNNLYFNISGSSQKLTSPLVIEDGVKNIGNNQFEGMAFNTIILPDSIESIGANAFDIQDVSYILYYGSLFSNINSSQNIPSSLIYYYVNCVHEANQFTIKNDVIITEADLTDWEIVKEAKCEENGLRRRVCNVCGEIIEEEIEAIGHNFGDWIITTNPTCTSIGKRQRHCLNCGEYEYEDIPMIAHSYNSHGVCSSCGDTIEYYEITSSENISVDLDNHVLIFTENADSYTIEIKALHNLVVEFDYAFTNEPIDSSLVVLVDSSLSLDTSDIDTLSSGNYSTSISEDVSIIITFNKGTDGEFINITNFDIKYIS